jgi:hypothetical protein
MNGILQADLRSKQHIRGWKGLTSKRWSAVLQAGCDPGHQSWHNLLAQGQVHQQEHRRHTLQLTPCPRLCRWSVLIGQADMVRLLGKKAYAATPKGLHHLGDSAKVGTQRDPA